MQKAITELIPSESLKKAIHEQGFILSELSLTEIAYIAAPDFDSRIKYLKMLEKNLPTEYGRYAGKLAEYEHKKLEIIKNGGDDIIYELNIKTAPNACTERFFCRDLDSALKLIPKYYKEYEAFCTETELSRYTVTKHHVFSDDDFTDDYPGQAVFLKGCVLYSVEIPELSPPGCSNNGTCIGCDNICIYSGKTAYPRHLSHKDAVKYYDNNGYEHFGIVHLFDDSDTDSEYYIIPLNSKYMEYGNYAEAHFSHEHIHTIFADRISPDELPEKYLHRYNEYCKYLDKN
ncbi:MAG: hypothetical protein IJ446_08480 [Oscillospiraceae bacterium]|nr:hypothetical protein [Oscillospiraceae bacterium]